MLCESTIALMGEEENLKRKLQSPERMVGKLEEADRLLREGAPLV